MGVNMLSAVRACIILTSCVLLANSDPATNDSEYRKIPQDFLLGVSSAAYQIEGAWNVSDKAESVWDRFVHEKKGRIHNDETGDVACDSYHKFRNDIDWIKTMRLKAYRFSVSWPRVLPTGFSNRVSKDGIAYYKTLVDELLKAGIEPIVTLYHWDHPQSIEDAGGWLNEQIVDWFADYAKIIFQELGPKVKKFITLNDPITNCLLGYSTGQHAPGKTSLQGISEYICVANSLKAHARVYRIYDHFFRKSQGGLVGVSTQASMYYPKTVNDTEAAEVAFQFNTGWMLHPIYSEEGDYPEIMKTLIERKSREQGYEWSRLPTLSPYWRDYIKGSADFLAVNSYTSQLVEKGDTGNVPSFANDQGLIMSFDPAWNSSASSWLKVVPQGFGDVLRLLAAKYDNPMIYVAENGFSDFGGTSDNDRVEFYQSYVREMLLAVNRDGVNVKGFFIWSLLDNFEWSRGYSERFGILHVNFTHPELARQPKQSCIWWFIVALTGRCT